MTGKEFREMRMLWGIGLSEMQLLLGINSLGSYRNYENRTDSKGRSKEIPLIMNIFFNYVNRYGLEKTKLEFYREFKVQKCLEI